MTRPFDSCVLRDAAGGSGVCWRARHNYDVTKHLHVWIVRPGERVADMHPFSYGLDERRTAHRHAVTLDREAGAHVWSCCDVACLLDSQRIQALKTPHDWAHYTEQRRPRARRGKLSRIGVRAGSVPSRVSRWLGNAARGRRVMPAYAPITGRFPHAMFGLPAGTVFH